MPANRSITLSGRRRRHMACRAAGILAVAISAGCLVWPALADDWPTYRHDGRRSAVSTEALSPPLSEDWVFSPAHGPAHAWGDPQPKPVEKNLELPRLRFDDAFHVAVAGGRVFFGSSSECKVLALDAATGDVRWEFLAEGPVRMAPTAVGGNVYFGSDDGKVYCVSAADGRPVWSFPAAPSPERVLGNGRMISLWPVRTGVLVEGGVAYFGAGVFPADGLYLYAVSAGDGRLLWKNDSYGQGGNGTVSPQGHLVASAERLFVPSGRAMPAAFSREDGSFLFHRNFSWRDIGHFGGTDNMLAGDTLYTSAEQVVGAEESTGRLALAEGLRPDMPSAGTHCIVIGGTTLYLLNGKEAFAADVAKWTASCKNARTLEGQVAVTAKQHADLVVQARRNKALQPQVDEARKKLDKAAADLKALQETSADAFRWRVPCPHSDALALARGMLLVGGEGAVVGLDPATGKQVWSAAVRGKARGIAVAGGRLFVSTDTGAIHCFVAGGAGKGRKVAPQIAADPLPKDDRAAACAKAAGEIVKDSGAARGYGLVLGESTGRLALELARRTDLMIYMIEPDAVKAAAARQALSAAGLYGTRVVVMQAPLDAVPCADYFANLIVCEGGPEAARAGPPAAEVLRMLKPCGGVAYVPRPAAARTGDTAALDQTQADWLEMRKLLDTLGVGEKDTKVSIGPKWAQVTRGPLPGAGAWTHEYANAANTACSDDQRVRGPIGILWYGEPGPARMASRHASAAAPLAIGGRMFVQGENVIMAYDAYNGVLLWERQLPGALRLGLKTQCSNLAANADSLFVVTGDTCQRLDAATGRTLRMYQMPPAKDDVRRNWHYLACVGGLIYGSSGTDTLFAIEIASGKVRWTYEGKTIMPATICIGGGRMFFVDRGVTPQEEEEGLKPVPAAARVDRSGKAIKPDVRLVVALDAETGVKRWARPQYVSDCVAIGSAGGELAAMYADGMLLLCAQPWNGHFWKEFLAGQFSRRSIIALAADDGYPVWSDRKGYRSRPLVVGDRIIAEPWAYDLKTGSPEERANPITGAAAVWQMARPGHHCGNIVAAPGALFFRSGSTAYYDLGGDYGTAHFGAQRPGCWINCIPANGLVLMPEAASGCMCPFALHTTVVFEPRKTSRVWGMFSAPGATVPVKRLAVNFGAPGDRRAADGTLWLSYPRPLVTERLVLDLKFEAKLQSGGGYFCRNVDFAQFNGAPDGWLYACGARGLQQCAIPVAAAGDPPARFTVRLLFAETENDKAGGRVFDVKLQGRTVLKGLDIFKEAGGAQRALVKEFKGVEAGETLLLEFVPQGKASAPAAMPLVSGIEIVRE